MPYGLEVVPEEYIGNAGVWAVLLWMIFITLLIFFLVPMWKQNGISEKER